MLVTVFTTFFVLSRRRRKLKLRREGTLQGAWPQKAVDLDSSSVSTIVDVSRTRVVSALATQKSLPGYQNAQRATINAKEPVNTSMVTSGYPFVSPQCETRLLVSGSTLSTIPEQAKLLPESSQQAECDPDHNTENLTEIHSPTKADRGLTWNTQDENEIFALLEGLPESERRKFALISHSSWKRREIAGKPTTTGTPMGIEEVDQAHISYIQRWVNFQAKSDEPESDGLERKQNKQVGANRTSPHSQNKLSMRSPMADGKHRQLHPTEASPAPLVPVAPVAPVIAGTPKKGKPHQSRPSSSSSRSVLSVFRHHPGEEVQMDFSRVGRISSTVLERMMATSESSHHEFLRN